MTQLVFVASDNINEIPFTTSKTIAEHGEVRHHTVTRLIQAYQEDILEFGKVRFQNEPLPSGQNEKVYQLNEQQATLLIAYMKNTPPVRKFKKALVREFYRMKEELTTRKVTRLKTKEARSRMTDAIRDYIADSPNKHWKYKHFTDLVYKKALGVSAKELRFERCAKNNDLLRDKLSRYELEAIEKAEVFVAGMVMAGYTYDEIKIKINRVSLITTVNAVIAQ